MKQESLLGNEFESHTLGPVECLGMTFESDAARRAHFTELLKEKLKDPEFRAIEGFPIGTDEAILELSDPPYYTACPNPWLNNFISDWHLENDDEPEKYHREPFSADIKEGRNDPIYNSHSYHTKVPYKAIMKYILHYTKPGDVVLDSFCGSGMTGVAANLCADESVISSLGYKVNPDGRVLMDSGVSSIGKRRAILNDLSPVATYLASNFNSQLDIDAFESEIDNIVSSVKRDLGWVYKTEHAKGKYGEINFTIWSDIFVCKHCLSEINYWDEAVDEEVGELRKRIECPCCGVLSEKKDLDRAWVSKFDPIINETRRFVKQAPVLINYTFEGKKYTKTPTVSDLELIEKIENTVIECWYPTERMPEGREARRNDPLGMTHVHDFFTKRNLMVLSACITRARTNRAKFVFTALMFKSSQLCAPLLSNYFASKKGNARGGWVGKERSGTLYCPSIHTEVSIFPQIKSRSNAMQFSIGQNGNSIIFNSSATSLNVPSASVDYVFIDPPFGSNIDYSEMSFIWEAWLGVKTNNKLEAIESKTQGKGVDEYRNLMKQSFSEVYRVLKPGKWMTVEFSNTSATVWNNIQSAILEAGFIVADVSALHKNQNSIMAYVTSTAVKQDLIISAYRPSEEFQRKFSSEGDESSLWEFIHNHLEHVPIVKVQDGQLVKHPERDPRILFDRVVGYFIRNQKTVPLNSLDFQRKLMSRFVERDGMVFLSHQVAEYDRNREKYNHIQQLSIFVSDEASAITWMQELLKRKPMAYSDIHPLFLNELAGYKKHEAELELSILLEQNFIKYDGVDEVPSQIHTYLSTNFKDMRGLDKNDPKLKAKAKDRWYVPDPNKAADLEKVRLRALLKEFELYKAEKKKIKQPRAEALRAGFNSAWEAQDFQTILDVSAKIPPAVLQEDEKLLMFYDNALTLTTTEDDEW